MPTREAAEPPRGTAAARRSSSSHELSSNNAEEADGSEGALTDPETVDDIAHVREQQAAQRGFREKLDELWSHEPPYRPSAEDRANWFQQLYYGWIGDFIYKAAAGAITEADLPPPTRTTRTYYTGKVLSQQTHADLDKSRRWDGYIGCEVVCKKEPETSGVLRWVGYIPQSDHPRALVAGVEWRVAPRHRRQAEPGNPVAMHNGVVHGERLFYPHLQNAHCSCEPVNTLYLSSTRSPIRPGPPPSPDLLLTLFKAHAYHMWAQILPKLLSDLASVFLPVLLEFFVKYLDAGNATWVWGLGLVLTIFFTSVVQSCASHKYDHISIRSAALFETSSMALLFEKCFTVSQKSLQRPDMSVGRIMNMAGNDVDNIGSLNWYVMFFWSAPLQLSLCIVLLVRLVGWCALPGVAVLFVTFPIQGAISKYSQEIDERRATVVDLRMKRTNELLSGIRIVKFMGWEPRFLALIERARERELGCLRDQQMASVGFMFVDGATPTLVIAVVFVLYHVSGHALRPEIVFPTIALLNTMRMSFFMIPIIVSALLQCLVSTRRVTTFLECPDAHSAVQDISEMYVSGAAAAFTDATINTYLPVMLPRCKSRLTSPMQRMMLWFRKRKVPEAEWYEVDDSAKGAASPVPASPSETAEKAATAAGDDVDGAEEGDAHYFQLLSKDLLHNVNLIFPDGQLTMVIGATGCGKSTLLGALMGEYEVRKGEAWAAKSIAYVPQQPWIMNATLRNNILFFDEQRPADLQDVIRCCQLEADLATLANGLETEIGEKGINLSGGQKMRVSLARAVYANREVYLLDDPLSALDANVGQRVVNDVFLGRLAGKTRVLATHQLHLLPLADHVVVLQRGRVAFTGSFAAFQQTNLEESLRGELKAETANGAAGHDTVAIEAEEDEELDEEEVSMDIKGCPKPQTVPQITRAPPSVRRQDSAKPSPGTADADDGAASPVDLQAAEVGKLMTNEEKAIGSVPWSTYVAYVKACGGLLLWCVLLAAFVVTEFVNAANGLWLSIWSTSTFGWEATTYMYVYLGIVALGVFSAPLRCFLCYHLMRIGSRNLHRGLLESLGVATVSFFDTTPLGRILNRFAKDIGIIDNTLNDSFLYLLQYFFSMCSTIAVMAVAQPLVLVALVPCVFIYYKLMQVYNASNRETRRIKSIAHSPVFTLLEESLQGQRTIATYGKMHVTLQEALKRLDVVYSALYMQNVTNRWLGTRLEFVSCVIISTVALFGVAGKMLRASQQSIGLISLSLTMAMTLTETLNWLVRQVATVEANMNSVERILHYIHAVDHEDVPEMRQLVEDLLKVGKANADGSSNDDDAAMVVASASPTAAAPHVVRAGALTLDHVQMRYREGLPLVLRDVSFSIAPREKVGVVGRTGSGKSTLLLTFMRMVDICGGEIRVDGRALGSYGLRELRRHFSMIPQDPVLFDGTVRLNVDPFLEASSAEVWHALELVGLRERVASETEGIDGRVLEGGSNFSVGQRQLMCMARALLKKGSGFILMDEATANIDPALDRQIQTTVMSAFAEYTVITIAHRLHTVAQYDKIIVMDHGVVAEMGSPRELVRGTTPFSTTWWRRLAIVVRENSDSFSCKHLE
ncbi:putative mitochondrial ABC-thiol transporter [Leptomonas pyrrhocoris]|uniref:Putative mitochondrial ABC-thiol transporter n=1 Tax=Leptomonas pyrrhocoris TaxID=157538 RepID=A0A0N0DYG8_LEPPY|nr:putative mitochondrial ABC-thiol transporter [Leptomonas pyrrhocoris]KPA84112.1 putative mitochondrial ABC-thiol transporter [Leptomonas pyrrhocoris]|eukprot:XP_015662551.1 putative mitochondrial ABC-thiol transporter [Leptomonas pyrrhocoris]